MNSINIKKSIVIGMFSLVSLLFTTTGIFLTHQGSLLVYAAPDEADNIDPNDTVTDVSSEFDKLKNPLRSDIDSIPKIIQIILDIALVVGIPIVALGLIYSGFLFVKAQGNETKLTEAKQAFLYVIIGAFILLGAYVISEAIGATINALRA